MTIYSVKFYIFWANSGLCHFHSRFVSSLNLDGSALSLMYMRTSSVCVILPALCRVTASELRDAGRQKPVTCLEPVLSVSLWPRPVFPRSGQVASAGIIPACASLSLSLSLLLQENLLAMAWDFSISPRLVWARRQPRLFSQSVYACLGMKIAC